MKHVVFFGLGILSVCFLTGCETVKGVGKDITGASTLIQQKISSSGGGRDINVKY